MPARRSAAALPAAPQGGGLATTQGTLLGGRVIYDQPLDGYRTGIEPVLLAASIAARAPGVSGSGVEQEPALAGLARSNAAANGFSALLFEAADLLTLPYGAPFDHAMANPPWYGPGATASPDPLRDAAKRGRTGLLHGWASSLSGHLRHGGSLTFILRTEALAEAMAAFTAAGCGSLAILPLWPRAERPARIVLLRGIRSGRGGSVVLPGLVLHGSGKGFTDEADRILRDGGALTF
jgi:tRNA1(Val) A37 N6-methylase TrmN6